MFGPGNSRTGRPSDVCGAIKYILINLLPATFPLTRNLLKHNHNSRYNIIMSRQINQPSNQIKLTNVSLVRLKKGKKRFEIACVSSTGNKIGKIYWLLSTTTNFQDHRPLASTKKEKCMLLISSFSKQYKNKVLEWRQGVETDIDNVLQIPNVFLNVSKGQTAPTEDLHKAFGKNAKRDDIILEILNKGDIQVGDKERAAALERAHNEVIGIVASQLVEPRTKRVYTTGMIEKALDMLSQQAHQDKSSGDKNANAASGTGTPATGEAGESKPNPTSSSAKEKHLWTGVVTTKSAKSQALEAIKALISNQPIPVARARMRLRITCATNVLKQAVKATVPEAAVEEKTQGKGKRGGKGKKTEDDAEDDAEKKATGTVKDTILGFIEQVESQDVMGSEWEVIGFVEPGAYKGLSDFIANQTRGQGKVEVLDTAVRTDDE